MRLQTIKMVECNPSWKQFFNRFCRVCGTHNGVIWYHEIDKGRDYFLFPNDIIHGVSEENGPTFFDNLQKYGVPVMLCWFETMHNKIRQLYEKLETGKVR